MRGARIFALVAIACALAPAARAQAPISPQPYVSGLVQPVEIAHVDDGTRRMFVVELPGRIRVVRDGQLLATPFLDIRAASGGPVLAGGEMGLLGLAFHPGYAANGRFYVFYTRARAGDPNGNEIVVARYVRSSSNPDIADPASGSPVIVVPHPDFGNHNGGKIAFGPDGYLYVAIGDGGGGGDPFGAARSLADLRGKILRLDVDSASPYAIPPANPFANSTDPGVRKEIWAYGLRNPWRFTFDRVNGDMWIGDVGQGAWEEIDLARAGESGLDFGWSVLEGPFCYNPPTGCNASTGRLPVMYYGHDSSGGFSITGGYRYRGTTAPALAGRYVVGDYGGRIWAATEGAGGSWSLGAGVATVPDLSTFGEDESGELYAASLGSGTIYRLTPPAETIPRLANLSTRAHASSGDDVVIAGFVIGGTATKRVAIVATGPSLAAHGVADPLADPVLTLVRSSDQSIIATNDSWQATPSAAQLQARGLAPAHPQEAALLVELAPGAYTVIASGAAGGSGVTVVAAYEFDHPERPLLNISTRAEVRTGDQVVIGGFVVQGSSSRNVVIVGTGPSLAAHGVARPLADPTLTLVRASDQAILASNDNWGSAGNAAQILAAGFAPAHPLESAILLALPPGAYTAILSGVASATGTGVVAIYDAGP